MLHVAVNKYDFEKINILEYAFGEGGHQKAYAVYALINVDNCERPLMVVMHNDWYDHACLWSFGKTVHDAKHYNHIELTAHRHWL